MTDKAKNEWLSHLGITEKQGYCAKHSTPLIVSTNLRKSRSKTYGFPHFIAEESRTHTVLCDKYSHLRQIKCLQYLYITAHFLFASAKHLFTQNCKASSGVEIFDGFSQSELKQDADLTRRDLAKDAKIARRRAYAFDSLRL